MGDPVPELPSVVAEMTKRAKARFGEMDEQQLSAFISAQPKVRGPVDISNMRYLSDGAGATNGIAFVTAVLDRGSGRQTETFVLRFSPGISLFKQKSFADEFLTLRAAHREGLPVPEVYWLDPDGSQTGKPSYLMELVVGDAPAAAVFSQGPIASATPTLRKDMMLQAADFHGRLRRAAIGPDKVPHLVGRGQGATPIERELRWWLKEAQLAAPPEDPRRQYMETVIAWLVEHQPSLYAPVLVHGDSQISNIMFRDGKLAAVIDWELSYLGHTETDLAFLCMQTETLQAMDKRVEGTPSDQEYISRYEAASGTLVQHWEYFQMLIVAKVMCVYVCFGNVVPSAEMIWTYHRDLLETAWNRARAA